MVAAVVLQLLVLTQVHKDMLKAIDGNNPSAVNMAIKSFGKINALTEDGDTSLMYAVRKGKYKAVKQILKAKGVDVTIADAAGLPLMHVAAAAGEARVLQTLLPAGLDPNEVHAEDGLKPIHRAVLSGSTDAVKTLLNAGVPADEPTADGRTCQDLLTSREDMPSAQRMAMEEVLKKFDRPKAEL